MKTAQSTRESVAWWKLSEGRSKKSQAVRDEAGTRGPHLANQDLCTFPWRQGMILEQFEAHMPESTLQEHSDALYNMETKPLLPGKEIPGK